MDIFSCGSLKIIAGEILELFANEYAIAE